MHVSFTASQLALIVGFVLPVVTSLLTKVNASPKVKAVLNAALAVLAGFFTTAVAGNIYSLGTLLQTMGITFIVSVTAYLGFHKPVGIAPWVGGKSANIGVGSPQAAAFTPPGNLT